jgi:hypothetical protein
LIFILEAVLALSVYALVRMTHFINISVDEPMANFVLRTIVGYNFVKYDALARAKKNQMRNELKLRLLSLFSLLE